MPAMKKPPTLFVKPQGLDTLHNDFIRGGSVHASQKKLISTLAPYVHLAALDGKLDEFYEGVYKIWFQRWPITGDWYDESAHVDWAMKHHKDQIRTAFFWARSTQRLDPGLELELTWEECLSREARQAAASECPKPRPISRPHPIDIRIAGTTATPRALTTPKIATGIPTPPTADKRKLDRVDCREPPAVQCPKKRRI